MYGTAKGMQIITPLISIGALDVMPLALIYGVKMGLIQFNG